MIPEGDAGRTPALEEVIKLKEKVDALATAVKAEFGVFLRKHRWFGGPEGMRNLQAMRSIRRAEFA